jgi:hypothetical protein
MTDPAMHETRVKIGREAGRGAERIALVATVLVLIAVLKPWGATPVAEPSVPQQAPAATQQPRVSPAETALALEHACNNRSWLIQVDMLWPKRLVRSWILIDAVTASGPTDPGIPFVTVASPQVRAIGYCPARDEGVPRDTRPTIYRLGPPVEVVKTDEVRAPRYAEGLDNVLYRPASAGRSPAPSGASPGPPRWEAGRYVLRIDGPSGFQRWLGLEIRTVDDETSG